MQQGQVEQKFVGRQLQFFVGLVAIGCTVVVQPYTAVAAKVMLVVVVCAFSSAVVAFAAP